MMTVVAIDQNRPTIHEQCDSTLSAHSTNTGWRAAIPAGHLLMIPVMLLAFFIRTQQISTVGVQCDESFCQKMVEFSWREMFYRLSLDTHPPLFYMVLKVWAQIFGNGIVAGRALTALCGISGVLAMYLFVRAAYRREGHTVQDDFLEADLPGFVAALILTVVPLHIAWSLQIRMYSMATALALWSSYFLIRALKRANGNLIDWAIYTIVALLLAHSHYFGLFAIAAQFIYAFGYRWCCGRGSLFDRLRPVLMSGCCLSLGFQPWLPYFLEQRNRVDSNFHLPKPSWEVLGKTMHELWIGFNTVPTPFTGLVISQVFVIVLLILAIGRRPADYLICLSVAVPVIAVFAISSVSHSVINSRYFQINQVFLMAAVAVVVCRVPNFGRYFAIALLGYLLYGPLQAHYAWREAASKMPGMQAAVARFDVARIDEPLIVCNPMLYTSVLAYSHDKANIHLYQPPYRIPFFQGTAIIRDDEFADSRWMSETIHDYLWTLGSPGFYGVVPVPTGWRLVQEERYEEWYANLVLRLYARSDRVASKLTRE